MGATRELLAFRQRLDMPIEQQPWGAPFSSPDTECAADHLATLGFRIDNVEKSGAVTAVGVSYDDMPIVSDSYSGVLRVGRETYQALSHLAPEDATRLDSLVYRDRPGSLPYLFGAASWALCIIKPDAKREGMERSIEAKINEKKLHIIRRITDISLTMTELDQLWPAPLDSEGNALPPSPWWGATTAYMREAPVDVLLINGSNASQLMVATKAELRARVYGTDYQHDMSLPYEVRVRSVIHTSDCDTELAVNACAFWNPSELSDAVDEVRENTK